MLIAIDGPAGSGKTTVSRLLSKRLNIGYLDTGATYRALTLKALQEKINLRDSEALARLAQNLNLKIEQTRVFLDGKDVSEEIRSPLIDQNISVVVSFPEVRKVMVDLQRRMVGVSACVVEGRDITTVVFPQAEFKFYLDADCEVRAKRRFKEFCSKSVRVDLKRTYEELLKRDEADTNRVVGPLTLSPDAVYVDTTHLTIEEVVKILLQHISNRDQKTEKNLKSDI